MQHEERLWLIALLLLTILVRLPFLGLQALVLDEALYAGIIDETIAHPQAIPHYLGQEVAWRPPLFFFAYAPFADALLKSGLQTEVAYRLPSAILGTINVLLVYLFARRLWGRDVAFAASALFSGSGLVIYVNSTVLADTLLLTFIMLAMNFYVLGQQERRLFLAAGVFAACAFLVKTVVALIIPVLAVSYFATRERGALLDKYFIASFFILALAAGGYFLAFEDRQAIVDEYLHNATDKLPSADAGGALERLMRSAIPFVALSFYMVGFYVSGAWQLRGDYFVLAWLAMGIFALFGGQWMPWYFMPIAPMLSVCAGHLFAKGGLNVLGKAVIAACIVAMVGSTYWVMSSLDFGANGERDAGIYLAGKENVLVAGSYSPSVVFYKNHFDGKGGRGLCWSIPGEGSNITNPEYMVRVAQDYAGLNSTKLTDIFWRKAEFGLPCSFASFKYISVKRADVSGLLENGYIAEKEFENNVTVLRRIQAA
jgi:4-amino-4-deoxy-L-arabinose transferase-like glycosyltransferase